MTDNNLLEVINGEPIKDPFDYSFKRRLDEAREGDNLKAVFGDFLADCGLYLLAGRPSSGKSVLAMQIANSIATGTGLLNQPNECEPSKVLLLDFELKAPQIKKRYENFEPPANLLSPDMRELMRQNVNYIYDFDRLEKDVSATEAKFLIIDNLSALMQRSSADADEALRIIKGLDRLANELNITVLALAHTPKVSISKKFDLFDVAGSHLLTSLVDGAFAISRSKEAPEVRYVKNLKNRNGIDDDEVLVCRMNPDPYLHLDFVRWDAEENHIMTSAIESMKQLTALEIADGLKKGEIYTNKELRQIIFRDYQKSEASAQRYIKEMAENGWLSVINKGIYQKV